MKCKWHLKDSDGNKTFQIGVSFIQKDGRGVGLVKKKLYNASFGETQIWTEKERGNLVNLKHAYGADLLDLRVLQGGL